MSLYDSISTQPWLMLPSGVGKLSRDMELRDKVKSDGGEVICDNPRSESMLDDNGIAHIHICGIIGHRLGFVEKFLGNTDVCDVRRELDAAQEAGANAIFLRIESPGGTTIGPTELSDYIASIGVPVFAYSDHCCASAAYWIASGARQIWSSISAEIGSIGILLPWTDKSAAWEAMGLSFEPITNDEAIYKSAGHGPSLTDVQREELVSRMNRIYDFFSHAVTRSRQVDPGAMQGQSFMGTDAQFYGLVDNVGTYDQAYTALCAEAGVFPIDIPIDATVTPTFENAVSLTVKKEK